MNANYYEINKKEIEKWQLGPKEEIAVMMVRDQLLHSWSKIQWDCILSDISTAPSLIHSLYNLFLVSMESFSFPQDFQQQVMKKCRQ